MWIEVQSRSIRLFLNHFMESHFDPFTVMKADILQSAPVNVFLLNS